MATLPTCTLTLNTPTGTETVTVTPQNYDLVRWDLTAHRNGWPSTQAAPILWLTFICWSQLKHSGNPLAGDDFDAFNKTCVGIESEEVDTPANPT